MNALADPTSKQKIYDLLDDLPPEALETVEGFVRFLRDQVKQALSTVGTETDPSASFRYPTVSLPLATLSGLVGIMPPVGGDALAETETVYDIKGSLRPSLKPNSKLCRRKYKLYWIACRHSTCAILR